MVIATKSASDLAPFYDAVVVGSGYGGGVAASRLARMGMRVAVLEQGRLWRPGDFPTTAKGQRQITRISSRMLKLGDPSGLYRLTVGKGLTVFAATGVGGGSLINAGVALRPSFSRLRHAGWPKAVVDDGLLEEGLARAESMLGAAPVPEPERFAKFAGMCKAAEASNTPIQLPSMTIAHRPGPNAAGVTQYACRYCGDCWSGCNVGAKNTVGITYIPDAVDHGAEVFCESRVDSIAQSADGWQIEVRDLSHKGGRQRTSANILVLAAGTLGTAELLLRAQDRGLALSDMLGEKFSANGDDLVVAGKLKHPVHAIATGHPSRGPRRGPLVGPHSMAMFNLGDADGPVWIHDGTMLAMMASMAPIDSILRLRFGEALRLLKEGIYGDELSRAQLYYVVAHDDTSGRLRLQKRNVFVDWPSYSNGAARVAAEEKAKEMVDAMGGDFEKNPFELKAFGGNRIIAHPLGGCAMGETIETGVVAPDGRVYDPTKGPAGVYDGLYVCDGAMIPSSVGVSPLLTIIALAERMMILASRRLGRNLDVASIPARPPRDAGM